MNRYYFFLLLLFNPVTITAQVTMLIDVPPIGLTVKPQLWNISVVNSTSQPLNVRVDMIMRELTSNQIVLSGMSRMITINKGSKRLTARELAPITYKSVNPAYAVDPNPDGFLPIGSFNVCYTLFHINSDAPQTLAEECGSVQIEPVSPPQLIMPGNNEGTTSKYPMFSWFPPAPLNLTRNLQYEWSLAEVNLN